MYLTHTTVLKNLSKFFKDFFQYMQNGFYYLKIDCTQMNKQAVPEKKKKSDILDHIAKSYRPGIFRKSTCPKNFGF